MNKATNFILGLYHFAVMIRDTLEYAYPKDSYNLNAYNARKNAITKALDEKGQIKAVLAKLGDNGVKIEEKLHEFLQVIYGDDSTVLRVASNELRVDHAQHLVLFDMVVGLHQTMWDIVNGYHNAALSRNELDIDLTTLLATDERMYRAIVFYAIMNEIEKVFSEFQRAMAESKGAKSPQSNYIVNDLAKLVQLLNFQKVHHRVKDTAFNEMIDTNMRVLEMIEGKRELPIMPESEVNPETKHVGVMIDGVRHYRFIDVFAQARNQTRAIVQESERSWKQAYAPIHAMLAEHVRSNGEPKPPFDA